MASKKNLVINDNDRRDQADGQTNQPSRGGNPVSWVMPSLALHGYALYSPILLADRRSPANERYGGPANDEYYQPMTSVTDHCVAMDFIPMVLETESRPRQEREAATSLVITCLLAFARLIHRGWKAHRRERDIRHAIARLSELDDYVLRDIGLRRSEIPEAVRRGGRRDGASPSDVQA